MNRTPAFAEPGASRPLIEHVAAGALPGWAPWIQGLRGVRIADPKIARQLQATTLPSASLHVVFCYGDELGISSDGQRWWALRSHVSGPMLGSHRIRADGTVGLLAVHLSELGARGFVAGPMRRFAHGRTPLADVLPAALVGGIEARLRRCGGTAERSAIAQEWVAQWIEAPARADRLDEAARRLRGDDEIRIGLLADELGLSERSLQRQFAQRWGVSPKQLALSERLRRAVQLSRGPASWTQIAHLCGFSDQAHLNRAFRVVFGQTPGQFRALHGDALLQPPAAANDGGPGDTAISLVSAAAPHA